MAFTLRTTEEQDESLEKLMTLTGTNTKSKAIFAMVENYERLVKRNEKLKAIEDAQERIKTGEMLLRHALKPD